ncbi:MAG: hypothetical protein K5686_05820 [Lachnospiraceae bacterium]|nr:hypothetical protein [Lachnospiraceae bacterium]
MNNSHRKIKILIVLLAVVFIIASFVIALNREKQEFTLTEPEVDTSYAENRILWSIVPPMPKSVSFNGFTRSECETGVRDGSMLKLCSDSGTDVYIRNYHDDALLKENVKDEEDFKAFLYNGFAIFDVDEEHVRSAYEATLNDYCEYIRNNYSQSVPAYIAADSISLDELTAEIMASAYRYVCDLEMSEAVLSDTIGDVTDEEIAELASSEGYDSTEEFIKENGRDSILYYLRPQKLLKYMDSRLEEIR